MFPEQLVKHPTPAVLARYVVDRLTVPVNPNVLPTTIADKHPNFRDILLPEDRPELESLLFLQLNPLPRVTEPARV